jgi:hypothetical protein
MMKYIFVALCLVAIVVASEVAEKSEHNIAKRQIDLSGIVGCLVAVVANIAGGLLRVIIGLVITLSGGNVRGD